MGGPMLGVSFLMNFKPRDMISAARRGVGPGDPRFVAAVQRAATQRERDESEELGRRILSQTQTMGFTLKESWASPREWATKNNARPPGWVHPSATIELWTREGAAFCVVFRHEGKSELYECYGDQPFRNWRRIL